jgi:phage recombination protein Bet
MSLSLQQKVFPMEFNEDKVKLLKSTVCKEATDNELELFLHVCNRTGLDPFRNQIYAIKRNSKAGSKMTIQTGIDGFRLIAERTGKYSPGKEPTFSYDQQGKIKAATAFIKKQTVDGTWHEVSATAYWNEYVQEYNGIPSQFWGKMPHTMLSKVAEALALRKAFPADFSGLYTTEEMAQADNGIEIKENNIIQIEQQEDLKAEEVTAYIEENWSENPEIFREYMEETIKTKNFDYRTCITNFEKHKEAVKKNFDKWLSKRK